MGGRKNAGHVTDKKEKLVSHVRNRYYGNTALMEMVTGDFGSEKGCIYIYTHTYICIYIYIYTHTREATERVRKTKGKRKRTEQNQWTEEDTAFIVLVDETF